MLHFYTATRFTSSPPFTCGDCQEIAGEVNGLHTIYSRSGEVFNTRVSGVTADAIYLGNLSIAEGRFFSQQEVRRSRRICVIGWELKEKFYPDADALGRYLKIQNEPLQVIGVIEKKGSMFGMSLDNLLYLPITSYQAILGTRQSITIRGQASSRETFNPALDQVQMAMRIRHQLKSNDADDFGLLSTDEINSAVDQFTRAVAMVVVPIALISLLVAGVVIMNIMLVSVSERTFEVGIRKTLGARRQDILYQFLIESFLLAGLGGTTGLGVASLICWIVDSNTSMTMTIPLAYALLSLGLSGGVGILFGIYPALQAAQLDPIVALRSER